MKIANTLKQWLKTNTGVDDSATETEFKGAAARAIRDGSLSVKSFADLQGDASLSHVTPDMLFGSGDGANGNGHKRGLSTHKSVGRHVKTGEPMRDERGREAMSQSEHEAAKAGAFLKHLAARGGSGISLTKDDRDLLEETFQDRWCGKFQSHYLAGLPGASVKAVLNDVLSGGAEVVPEWFDDNLITFPLLTSELFPFVDLRGVPRANSVEAASVGNPDVTWGTSEGTAVTLFDTSSLIAEINTSIHPVTVALEVGRDFLADAAADVGRTLTENIGQKMSAELDRVIGAGNGTSEPQGLTVASGIGTVPTDNSAAGPPTLADYETLMFAIGKQYRSKAMRPAFVSNDVTYRRSRGIAVDPTSPGSTDQRPVFGLDAVNSYMTLDWPHRIQGDIGNAIAIFGALSRYRMYRRQGFEVRWEFGGKELARRNLALLIVRGRFGGRVIDASAFAKWIDGQS
ncbi:MAG: phage major capsid protein [Planctomycetia bacterium]|nr:phage major capsid protein [Planctomycetia bacterium]